MRIPDLEKIDQFGLARELIARGLRTMPTVSLTGLSPEEVRGVFRLMKMPLKVYGSTGSSIHLCPNRMARIRWSLFASIYRAIGGERVQKKVDPHVLISSFDLYESLDIHPEPNLTSAWIIAHELRASIVHLVGCQNCGLKYLRIYGGARISLSCPFCAMRQSAKRPQQQVLGR